ncbi:MAG: DUF4421 family protein [Bdellovibrio sp.]|nr:DUF4421 family protein [Bdellovibrio sp.]
MRLFAIFMVLLFAHTTFANVVPANVLKTKQEPASGKQEEYGNSIQIGTVVKTLKATTNEVPQNHDVALDPNTPSAWALGLSNRYLGLSLMANVASGARDPSKVNTTAEDYQFRYFKEKIGVEFIYQKYKGFNQSAKSTATDPFIDEAEYTLKDLSINMMQLQFDWAFYGVSALDAFGATWEKPRQDGVAYYLLGGISELTISNPTPFLPQGTDSFGDDKTLTKGSFKTLTIGLGASYLWQWTRFYAAIFAGAQGGPQKQEYQTVDTDWDNLKYVWSIQGKVVVGYDWGPWYVYMIGHTHPVTVNLKDTQMSFFSQDGGFYVGSRF